MSELRSHTKKRQDEIRELGRSAGQHATPKLREHLKQKHCLTPDEEEEFDKGVQEGEQTARQSGG